MNQSKELKKLMDIVQKRGARCEYCGNTGNKNPGFQLRLVDGILACTKCEIKHEIRKYKG